MEKLSRTPSHVNKACQAIKKKMIWRGIINFFTWMITEMIEIISLALKGIFD